MTATISERPASSGLSARREAVNLVGAVIHRHRLLDEEFDASVREGALKEVSARDRRLCYALAATTLRRHGELRFQLNKYLKAPLPKSAGPAFEVLLVAAAQILHMRIPSHAAVDTAVSLAKSDNRARHFSGLINAICRSIARDAETLRGEELDPSLNTPPWLVRRWTEHFGSTRSSAIVLSHVSDAPADITVRADPSVWASRLGGEVFWGSTVRMAHWPDSIRDMPGFAEGQWWVQDAAAALPVHLLGEVGGLRVLDLCAAPGGKTAQLAAAGARVTAVERSRQRSQRLQENLSRLGLTVQVIEQDLLSLPEDSTYDAVLLDAPCSATGTIRRHPDLVFHLVPDQIPELAALQLGMIRKAAALLRPGGILVYSTCSLEPEEGPAHIDLLPPTLGFIPFLAEDFDFRPQWVNPRGYLQTTPDQGLDGFFAMRLRKLVPA